MTETTVKDDGDWLGYGVYAETLWGRIERALAEDLTSGQLGDDPMVIGIFGEWGAGKSQLLKLTERRAQTSLSAQKKKHAGDAGFELTVPVWFQPWKYEHEEHLHVPMVIHVLNALKDALKPEANLADTVVNTSVAVVTAGQKAAPIVQKTIEMASSAYPIVQKILKSITVFGCNVDLPDEVGEWLETAADGVSDVDLKSETKVKVSTVDAAAKHTADGSYFYRIHELLGALTRPHQYKHRKDLFKDAKLTLNTRINFVVFIDDLDRCLPEKAVQTLEMIKTIFNIESFAFVLALDDEVIERGIGHRYQAYNFAGKKPEMPITGFEYLEKIVHLPFKLPALTQTQAKKFIAHLEDKIAPKAEHWFQQIMDVNPNHPSRGVSKSAQADIEAIVGSGANLKYMDLEAINDVFDLSDLTLKAFDAYVPRKLTRMVELWYATVDIAKKRHAKDGRKELLAAKRDAQIDIRIAFTVLMVQLFHPDLYRVFRRHEETFGALYNAFDVSAKPEDTLSASMSDIDLWHWAAYRQHKDGKPTDLKIALEHMAKLDDGYRYGAQQKRLPLVERLIEHRAAQRHVFDALKLFAALKKQMPMLPKDFKIAQYFSLLAEFDEILTPLPVSMSDSATVGDSAAAKPMGFGITKRPSTDVSQPGLGLYRRFNTDANVLYNSVISADVATQEAIPKLAGFVVGQYLQKDELEGVLKRVTTWLNEANKSSEDRTRREHQLLHGLNYLARYIAPFERDAWWGLVKTVDENSPDSKIRAQWHDVRAALGQDSRFEGPYALPSREPNDAPEAPAGFVKCPIPESGEYVFDDGDEMRPQKRPYYISRYAVTVAQYAAFVDDRAYDINDKNKALWEASHKDAWLWRTGEFDSSKTIENKGYKEWLARRPADLRHQPMDWAEQLANPNRPVTGVTWFEATAYAAWLEQQRQVGEGWGTLKDAKYRLRLPTEGEWERAARAGGTGKFPWGDDETDIDQRANVDQKVGHPTTVGSYPPNALGLYDMAGNVWQWQANLYTKPYENKLIATETELHIDKDWQSSARPALRGGSWFIHPDFARCSFRGWFHPDDWCDGFGFRLVLSLADFES